MPIIHDSYISHLPPQTSRLVLAGFVDDDENHYSAGLSRLDKLPEATIGLDNCCPM
jgi:hypothetical protein